MKCYSCNKRGHYSGECPEKNGSSNTEETRYAENLSVNSDPDSEEGSLILNYDEGDILLDTGSTVSVFINETMITDVKEQGKQ